MANPRLTNKKGKLRHALTTAVILGVCGSLMATIPASGAASRSTSSAGMEGAVASQVVKPAPSGFKQTMVDYFNNIGAAAQQYPQLAKQYNMTAAVADAQKLLASATTPDLAALYYWYQRMPQLHLTVANFRTAGKWYAKSVRWMHLHPNGLLRPHNYDDSCVGPVSAALVASLNTINDVANTVYGIFPDSFTIEVAGEGTTFPASPIKIIASIARIITNAAYFGVYVPQQLRSDCTTSHHQSQMDSYVTYNQDHIANVQINITATPIDAYHFLIAAHENGQAVTVNPSGIQLQAMVGASSLTSQTAIPLITNGVPVDAAGNPIGAGVAGQCLTPVGSTISQVSWCQVNGTDPGLYELVIPTTKVGTSYRIVLDDGTTCPTSPDPGWPAISNCDHYGVQTFTKATNS